MLIEKLSSLAIMGIVLAVLVTVVPQFNNNIKIVNNDLVSAGSSLELSNSLDDVCVQHNTFTYPENYSLSCLSKSSCSSDFASEIFLIGAKGEILSRPTGHTPVYYNSSLNKCDSCATPENMENLYTLNTKLKLTCGADCTKESIIELNAKFSGIGAERSDQNTDYTGTYTSETDPTKSGSSLLPPVYLNKVITTTHVYRSCSDAFNKGNKATGLYYLDFDGHGGECPQQFYCKMSGGKPRMLILNAPVAGYKDMPEQAPPIMPTTHGRINAQLLKTIMKSSLYTYVTVNVKKTTQGDLTFNFKTSTGGFGSYSTLTNECTFGNTYYSEGKFSLTEYLSFKYYYSPVSIGYSEGGSSTDAGIKGFHCLTCKSQTNEYTCGLGIEGCCQTSLPGEVWLAL